ncbi:MAG TPA: acyltransferase, partial [Burkholderiaceae bacterium]|nr:acyltransferase [Burkholderiaceae bacterium]
MQAPERFHSLDALRGVAALAVVLCHWRMWTLDAKGVLPTDPVALLPFPAVMAFFDISGKYAVGLFFSLSGFVFYWLYRRAIRDRRVDARAFAGGRFARLYPLQFATLVIVAAGQAIYMAGNGGIGFGFVVNDPADFFKHLFLFPLWGRERNYTFNGPDWTLAIECFLYACFYVAARWLPLGIAATAALVAAGACVAPWSPDMSWGLAAFFMGGLTCLVFERVRDGRVAESVLRVFLGISWPLAFICGSHAITLDATSFWWLDAWYATYLMFPATLLYLALVEARRGTLGARLGWLGDITYSTYLLH